MARVVVLRYEVQPRKEERKEGREGGRGGREGRDDDAIRASLTRRESGVKGR